MTAAAVSWLCSRLAGPGLAAFRRCSHTRLGLGAVVDSDVALEGTSGPRICMTVQNRGFTGLPSESYIRHNTGALPLWYVSCSPYPGAAELCHTKEPSQS